ncbi:MAG TPA: CpsB/CapC family capsule biosynthesis tyrosine phosphatase [Gemmatimonadaceae bacterium]|nr:CpsB/CapC family capsule biosynthesis tyrosine phosphatase [Gemmatimonadaceae bacterium]
MIDLHTHLLPGVDDGSPTATHSATVLRRMQGEGVRTVVCTPHLKASEAWEAPVAEHARLRDELITLSPPEVTLLPGFEIMLDLPGIDLTAESLALGGSPARLVEFPRRGLPAGATEELLRLRMSGVLPVVAHPERYNGCTVDTLGVWRELGAVMQADAMALLGAGPMADFSRQALSEGLVDVLASDNHGDRRSLATARDWLTEMGAMEQAQLLTEENPRRLLAGEALLPVPPIRFRRGVFDRLRELVFGSRPVGTREARAPGA